MVDFKVSISDDDGKAYKAEVSGHHANTLLGKKIGDSIDGIFVNLPGYKLEITGGMDKDGFPMRRDLPGPQRKALLVSESTGFRPKENGVRARKKMRGNTISQDISVINMKVVKKGSRPIPDVMKSKEEKE